MLSRTIRGWRSGLLLGCLATGMLLPARVRAGEPLRLHPDNPHYFLFRGRPTVLIGSTEHYGAVLNDQFDYKKYLDALAADGLNLTRTFSGVYRENPAAFGIVANTLAPSTEHFLCPWARTSSAGSDLNGAKFDLTRFNDAFFARLKDFVTQAGRRGIVVELAIFCAIYDDPLWAITPLNPANNVNELSGLGRLDVYTLKDQKLVEIEQALARKFAAELADFDNVLFEICNEPYFGGVTPEWNRLMVETIRSAESQSQRRLIAQNIANGAQQVKDLCPGVSLLNFHYATPPDAVAQNHDLPCAIGDDETGFKGTGDSIYRGEGWDFLLAGGALFDHLDYSFATSHPDGTLQATSSPGGGSPALRKQLAILKTFVESLDLVHTAPSNSLVTGGLADKVSARVLANPGKSYGVYVRGGSQLDLQLDLPAGKYRAEWIETQTGDVQAPATFTHAGGPKTLVSPTYQEDIALRILATP